MKGAAIALASLEAMVHVTEHHQVRRPLLSQTIESQCQIRITPITGGRLPISATRIMGL